MNKTLAQKSAEYASSQSVIKCYSATTKAMAQTYNASKQVQKKK